MGSWRRIIAVGGRILKQRHSNLVLGSSCAAAERFQVNSFCRSLVPIQNGSALQSFHGLSRMMSTSGPTVAAAGIATQPLESQPEAAGQAEEATKSTGGDKKRSVPDDQKIVKRNPVSWLSFFLLVATAAGLMYVFDREKKRRLEELRIKEADVKYGPGVGKAAIGGPFTFVNHEGKTTTEKDFLGKWTLIYFGFTSCPDICPDELQKMVQAIDIVEKRSGKQIAPVFVSVDPERDTVEQMKEYVQEFHPRLIGLTGTPEEVKRVAKSYRVYYMKTGDPGDDYLVDHSIIMYLMNPDMDFVKFFGKNYSVEELSDGLIEEMKKYETQPAKEDQRSWSERVLSIFR